MWKQHFDMYPIHNAVFFNVETKCFDMYPIHTAVFFNVETKYFDMHSIHTAVFFNVESVLTCTLSTMQYSSM